MNVIFLSTYSNFYEEFQNTREGRQRNTDVRRTACDKASAEQLSIQAQNI